MKIDPSKKYTSGGKEVTHLHCVPDGWPTLYPWRGLVDGIAQTWDVDGRWDGTPSDLDLIEVREPREWKVSIRKTNGEIFSYDPGDEGDHHYEVIRVREIIEP